MIDQLEALAAALLPDSIPTPYWFWGEDLPETHRDEWALGLFSRLEDVILADYLVAAGRYRGRAPAIVLYRDRIAESVGPFAYDEADLATLRDQHTLATGLHELAHVCELGWATDFALTPANAVLKEFATEIRNINRTAFKDTMPLRAPWYYHQPKWLRILVHAHFRATRFGFDIPIELCWVSWSAGAPTPPVAMLTLDKELEKLAHVPLDKIDDYCPPDRYAHLWRQCAERWRSEQPTDYPEADETVAKLKRSLPPFE